MKALITLMVVLAAALGIVGCGSAGTVQPAATVTVTASRAASTLDAAIGAMNAETAKLKDKAVTYGARSIMLGCMSYAVDHGDLYPKASLVNEFDLSQYVDLWPTNPFTDLPMAPGNAPGDFNYGVSPDRGQFQVIGYGHDGTPVITLP